MSHEVNLPARPAMRRSSRAIASASSAGPGSARRSPRGRVPRVRRRARRRSTATATARSAASGRSRRRTGSSSIWRSPPRSAIRAGCITAMRTRSRLEVVPDGGLPSWSATGSRPRAPATSRPAPPRAAAVDVLAEAIAAASRDPRQAMLDAVGAARDAVGRGAVDDPRRSGAAVVHAGVRALLRWRDRRRLGRRQPRVLDRDRRLRAS